MSAAAKQASSPGWTHDDDDLCSRGFISCVGGKVVLPVMKLFGHIGSGVMLTTLCVLELALYDK